MRLPTRRPTEPMPSDATLDDYLAAQFDDIADVVALLVRGADADTRAAVADHLNRTARRRPS